MEASLFNKMEGRQQMSIMESIRIKKVNEFNCAKWMRFYIILLFLVHVVQSQDTESLQVLSQNGSDDSSESRFKVVSIEWEHVQTPFLISIWLLLASIAKILFHANKKFGEAVPDSALLIVVGLLLGYVLHSLNIANDEWLLLKPRIFFLYLLPPIMFDAGYFMPNRLLFENIGSILLFALGGTIWNTVAIGGTLMFLNKFEVFTIGFSPFEILLFAALISAVDPVAVFAVFEEMGINEFLFITVFGESLFNDSVSVVVESDTVNPPIGPPADLLFRKGPEGGLIGGFTMLYQMCLKFLDIGESRLVPVDYDLGALTFFIIAIGGIIIGLSMALIVSIVTRFTGRVKIVAPVFIFIIPYLAYLTAEMFGVSSILAIVTCGMAMKQYVKGNITHEASISVKYFVRTLAQCSETVAFMFLGLTTVTATLHWDTMFIAITITCCIVYRIIGVVVLYAMLNRFRIKKFSAVEQIVLSYGGLRGVIAFGLTVAIPASIAARQMFLTTCFAVVFFTVFVQGSTIRPLLLWLNVETKDTDREDMLIEKIYDRYYHYTMAGVEDIAGFKGSHSIRDRFERFNASLLKPVLMKNERKKVFDASDILRAYAKINIHETFQFIASLRRANRVEAIPSQSASVPALKCKKDSADTEHAQYICCRCHQSSTFSMRDEDTVQIVLIPENAESPSSMLNEMIDCKTKDLQSTAAKIPKGITRVTWRGSGDESYNTDDIKVDYMQAIKSNAHKGADCVSTNPNSQLQLSLGSITGGQLPRRLSLPSMKDMRNVKLNSSEN